MLKQRQFASGAIDFIQDPDKLRKYFLFIDFTGGYDKMCNTEVRSNSSEGKNGTCNNICRAHIWLNRDGLHCIWKETTQRHGIIIWCRTLCLSLFFIKYPGNHHNWIGFDGCSIFCEVLIK